MKHLPRFVPHVVWCSLVAGALILGDISVWPQTPGHNSKGEFATIRGVSIIKDGDDYGIEVTSSVAVIPAITQMDGPPRLIIDLLGAVDSATHEIPGKGSVISAVHVTQFDETPPLTRVTIDLKEPRSYVWEVVENRMLVHLRPMKEAPDNETKSTVVTPRSTPISAGQPGVPGTTSQPVQPGQPLPPAGPSGASPIASAGVAPAGLPGSANRGTVLLAGRSLVGDSVVTAGADTAILNLARGGQLHVCPGTTVSVTSSKTGRDLMLGMSTGSLEAHYLLASSSDSILTPDFRILLQGPGEFHYAVSADSKGNTCVRALEGNTSSAIISELIGDGIYQVKPNEQVVFHGGQVTKLDSNIPIDCGCPGTLPPVLRAEGASQAPPPQPATVAASTQPAAVLENTAGSSGGTGAPPNTSRPVSTGVPMPAPETAANTPPPQPGRVQVQVDAPLVFRASKPEEKAPKKSESISIAETSATGRSGAQPSNPQQPSPTTDKSQSKPRRGFFGRMKHFLSSVFG